MADLHYSTLPNSFKFSRLSLLSVPLNFSPHPNSSIIGFAPLKRRFSQFSILAKLSSDSSQFDIISRTEHSDGTVIFKFGDATEILESAENLEDGNEVELEREGNSSLVHQANAVTGNESDSTKAESIIINNSVEVNEIGNEPPESLIISQSDALPRENSVAYEHNIDSISIANEPSPADSDIGSQSDALYLEDSVEDEKNIESTSTAEVEVSSGFDKAKHETAIVNHMVDKSEELSQASEEIIDDNKLEYGGDQSLSMDSKEFSDGLQLGYGDDEPLSMVSEETSDGDKLEFGVDESLSISIASEETSDDGKLEHGGAKSLSITSEEKSDVGKLEYGGDESLSEASEETIDGGMLEYCGDESLTMASDGGELEYGGVETSSMASEATSDGVKLEYGGDESTSMASKETCNGGQLEYGAGDETSAIYEETSDAGKLNYVGDERSTSVFEEMIDGNRLEYSDDELSSIASEEMTHADNVDVVGEESSNISETSLNIEASDMIVPLEDVEQADDNDDDDAAELISPQLEAEPILDEETSFDSLADVAVVASSLGSDKVMEAGHSSIARLDDDQYTHDISGADPPGNEASEIALTKTIFDRTNSVNIEDVSSGAASSALDLEVDDASPPTISQSDDGQHSSDTSQSADPGPESSEIASAIVSLDSMEISSLANPMTPAAASSPDSSEVHDVTSHIISQSDGLRDILVAAGPFSSSINSAETSLDSSNEVETSAPAFHISSSVASLSHSLEALTGGKDAHFVSEDWFGVADGFGQWSLEGVDVGLYAHELMQNCEKLLKSMSARITNVKDLLQQSIAMTQSKGSTRVVIGHVANQVLHVANIGDSGFVIIRNGAVFKKSSPMVHEFGFPYAIGLGDDSIEDIEEYQIELEDGDVIVTATDGLFDNLYEQEIASTVSTAVEAGMHVQDLAQLLATKAQEVGKSEYARSPFADAAQAAGHPGCSGGKFDHVTVVVSLVQTR